MSKNFDKIITTKFNVVQKEKKPIKCYTIIIKKR